MLTDPIAGGKNADAIEDVKYLRDKMFSGLKIPQAYLTSGEGSMEDKGTLAQKDIRFARTIGRLQRCMLTELEKVAMIHLYVLGFRGKDLLSFSLKLNNPSKIAELQELEYWKAKFEAAKQAPDGFFSKRWLATELLDISEEVYLRNQRELFYDKQVSLELEYVGQEAEAAAAGGGGGGGLGGDLGGGLGGGDLGAGAADLAAGGEESPPAAGAEAPTGDTGGDTALLAAPGGETPEAPAAEPEAAGKRDDRKNIKYVDTKTGETTTTKSKGWYKPVDVDKRSSGARSRHIKSLGSHEMARAPERQLYTTLSPNAKALLGLTGLGKGIFENQNTNYDEEEKKLFETKESVKKLFEDLELLDE